MLTFSIYDDETYFILKTDVYKKLILYTDLPYAESTKLKDTI